MKYKLRDYQKDAVDGIYKYWKTGKTKHPVVIMPTGSGKTMVLSQLISDITPSGGRVCVLSHRAELLVQNSSAIKKFTDIPVKIYSAMLGSKEVGQITVAGIQSIGKKAKEFEPFDVVIIDEAQMIPFNKDTMYRKFLDDQESLNPNVKFIGLTASPYRLDGGYIHKGDHSLFDGVAYEVPVKKLLTDGYITPLVSKSGGETKIDLSKVHKRGGEYITGELTRSANVDSLNDPAVKQIIELGADRKSWLLFTTGVPHAEKVLEKLLLCGIDAKIVTGETPKDQRAKIVEDFKTQKLKCLVNIGCFTEGFDCPSIDLIGLLTATNSTSLYVQMLGRGVRLFEGKQDCLVLDYGGNVKRHGFFDDVRPKIKIQGEKKLTKKEEDEGDAPVKECPECDMFVHTKVLLCPYCGYFFNPKLNKKAYDGSLLKDHAKPKWCDVIEVRYAKHTKTDTPPSVRITYKVKTGKGNLSFNMIKEWICPEHTGFARKKFVERCIEYKIAPTETVEDFLSLNNVPVPSRILVDDNGKYAQIKALEW